jgi:hypothetical protein
VFAPLGNRPEAGDFESAMRANIEALDAVAPRAVSQGAGRG